jgi:hypothetical protein
MGAVIVVDFDGQADDSAPLDVAGDILSTLQTNSPEPAYDAAPAEVAPVEAAPQVQQDDSQQQGDHPAWAPFREALGDALYYSIKPQLAKMSDEYHQHVTKVNAQLEAFKPFQPLVDAGIDQEFLSQSLSLGQAFNQDPVAFYQQMSEYLQAEGKLPANPTAAQVQVAIEDEFGDGAENQPDPEVSALRQQVEGMQNMILEAQRQVQLEAQTTTMETQFRTEIEGLPAEIKDNPQALALVIKQAQAELTTTGRVPKMADVAANLLAFRETILKTPRPNDSAPRLPGSGGGIPAGQKPLEQFTKADDVDYITSLIEKSRS